MGCRSDYLEPTEQEVEARRVAHLSRVMCALIQETGRPNFQEPPHLLRAAKGIYADGQDVHTLTAALCEMLRTASEATHSLIETDSRPDVVSLRQWWQRHQTVDAARESRESAAQPPRGRFARLTKTLPESKMIRITLSVDITVPDTAHPKRVEDWLNYVLEEADVDILADELDDVPEIGPARIHKIHVPDTEEV